MIYLTMDFQRHTLSNGIRLVHVGIDAPVAHCGIMVNAGTRDEKETEHGMAHFIEHVIFKGTNKRNVYRILNRLDNVGADLNAYTTKEETCIHASFLNRFYERTLELIADIVFNPAFPEKELAKEKDVIIDEINSYKDNPSEKIYDDFEELVFDGHPIARNILGTVHSIKKFGKAQVLNFIRENYHTDQMVISTVGKIDFGRFIRLVEKYFGSIAPNPLRVARIPFQGYHPQVRSVKKRTYQTHCMLGNIAYPYYDPRRITMALLNNVLGGPGMNSRLNLSVREKNGLAYTIESGYNAYSDTGIFSIYAGIENGTYDRALAVIMRELRLLREKSLGPQQLRMAKQQLIGQLAIAYESKLTRMISMGKSILLIDRVESLDQIGESIQAVTSHDILEVANEVLNSNRLSILTYLSK
jgi:predicted Zn-dependent peptidase